MTSIRRRTLVTVLLVFAFTTGAIASLSYRDATHEVEELFDARLAQQARLLLGVMREPLARRDRDELLASFADALAEAAQANQQVPGHRYEGKTAFQIWKDQELVLRSGSAPEERLADVTAGYANSDIDGFRWRVFAHVDAAAGIEILVGERSDVRGELVERIVLQTLMPDLLGLPLLVGLLWWAIGWGLRPLSSMADDIGARDPHQLQPVRADGLPTELAAMAHMLNRLLADVESLRRREKEFIADAAHELRTPLAVLDLHAQNAIDAESEADRLEAQARLREGVARASRVVSQLLTLARLEPEAEHQPRPVATEVLHDLRETLAELAPLADTHNVELQLEADETSNWRRMLEPATLDIIVKNLVSNAILHSPAGGLVAVAVECRGELLVLTVADQGNGIPAESRAHMVQRFGRAGPRAGAGLGLSIVARLAQRHHGAMELVDAPSGGLMIVVTLAAPPA